MKSKYGKEFSRGILDLLMKDKNKIINLLHQINNYNNDEFKIFQNNLLSVSGLKEEINNILKLSKGLFNSLAFIKENLDIIYKIL